MTDFTGVPALFDFERHLLVVFAEVGLTLLPLTNFLRANKKTTELSQLKVRAGRITEFDNERCDRKCVPNSKPCLDSNDLAAVVEGMLSL